jgi:hypothetical protein
MTVRVSWQQALAWRMRRHLLDPVGRRSVPEVVDRLCGVQAQVASSAELAIRVRRRPRDVGRSTAPCARAPAQDLGDAGTLHLLTPEEAGTFLSLVASGRS